MPKKTPEPPVVDEERPADCRQVSTQVELDAALAARATNSSVCIHFRVDAEASVQEWAAANVAAPEIAGEW